MGDGKRVFRLTPYEIALLRGGPPAAVTVAVVALHLRGAVGAGPPGTVRRTGTHATDAERSPRPLPPLERAVLDCLAEPDEPDQPARLREIAAHPAVRLAVAGLRTRLAAAGLLRAVLPAPTRTARRLLRDLAERHPPPSTRDGLTEGGKLLAVALHGKAALRVLVPRFALRAGLTERVEVGGKRLLRHSPRNLAPGDGDATLAPQWCGDGGGGGGSGGD
ncbi:TIGR04222 domain-containing membrane protein [Streptomyces sp. PRKS01-65]|nr:TIGR04222 domain-containing membrane protein [Streptomyces harenosi]NEY32657.1 TIGR04222 domain-containing membrane protein [Streptomyces harenosi]